jgi:outer membrane protein assembly factor BamB
MLSKARLILAAALTLALALALFLLLFFMLPKEKITIKEGSWAMPGGNPAHSAYVPSGPAAPLNEKWDTRLEGKLVGQPAVSQDRVYACCEGGLLYCLDLETGKPVWRYDAGTQITSMPALAESGVLLSTADGAVLKVSPDGKLLWRVEAGGAIRSSPIPEDGKVYFGSDDCYLYCVSLKDGSALWSFRAAGPVQLAPCVSEGQVFAVSYQGDLSALDANNGNLNWTFQSGSVPAVFPCADNGKIFLATEFDLNCIDVQSGKVLWRQEIGPSTIANLTLRGNQVVMVKGGGDRKITLVAMDYRTGDPLWNHSFEETADATSIVSSNDNLYFGGSSHIMAVSAESGSPVFERQLKGALADSLAATPDLLLLGTDNRKVYCFQQ